MKNISSRNALKHVRKLVSKLCCGTGGVYVPKIVFTNKEDQLNMARAADRLEQLARVLRVNACLDEDRVG